MSQTEQWSIQRLLVWTTDYFKGRGLENSRLEAELLLAHALECERLNLYLEGFNEPVADEPRARFRELVKRRAAGEPCAYLLGEKEFYSLKFRVNSDVLIPRPETESLVLALIDEAQKLLTADEQRELSVADVGCGSGAIGVCAAHYLPRTRVTMLDVSPAALEVAAGNVHDNNVDDKTELLESDLLAALPAEQKFDFIVSNPPYITQQEYDGLPVHIKDHEPQVALLSGPAGTEVIVRLISQAATRLRSNGWLMMEISRTIQQQVQTLLEESGKFQNISINKEMVVKAQLL